MRRAYAAFSPKKMSNTHPKHAVRWRPDTTIGGKGPGFYKPKLGASKMKWHFTVPYVREQPEALFHYPEVSRVTGKVVDWYNAEPEDGYEAVRIFGENTLELRGMPMGRTPEYMQERLRRFFSKFGPVKHCRAEPHPLDPYQCEGTAYVTFRDKNASMKALKAPLKFPASLHDKVIHMRHLDTDKRNDPDYYEKGKFWNGELVSLARQLHVRLSGSAELRADGLPITSVSHGLVEREMVAIDNDSEMQVQGRGGIPPSRGGLALRPTRNVPARVAVQQRFKSWEAFLAEPPFDELFKLERRGPTTVVAQEGANTAGSEPEATNSSATANSTGGYDMIVVRPRLVSSTQRARILARCRMALARHLHGEFSVWWRTGKVPLPEYTQRRIEWWDHKPKLPFELQIMSRSHYRHRIHDERFLYRHQLMKARNEKRNESRREWRGERKQILAEKQQRIDDRRKAALKAVEDAKVPGVLGFSRGLLNPGWEATKRANSVRP